MLSPSQETIGYNWHEHDTKQTTELYELYEIQHLHQEYKGDKKRHRGKGWCPPIHAEYEGFMEEESMD